LGIRDPSTVTVLADGGGKYQSRLFNRGWLAERGLSPDP
jgi:cysteine synthase A